MDRMMIEQLPEIKSAATVLSRLEERGLVEPAIASGWLRGYLTDIVPTDIDVAYVGSVPYRLAGEYLREILEELHLEVERWDVQGIWNATAAYGLEHTEQNYLLYYVDSIDSVYLASDGQLHDPTGFGFADAASLTLRLNTFALPDRPRSGRNSVYIALEGCRRMYKFGWTPTKDTVTTIENSVQLWSGLPEEAQIYFKQRLHKKYRLSELVAAKAFYEQYGWGFVFE